MNASRFWAASAACNERTERPAGCPGDLLSKRLRCVPRSRDPARTDGDYTLLEQWRRAVNVLEQLVETESGKDKARYLVAIANILNYELQSRSRPSSSMTKRSTRTRTTAQLRAHRAHPQQPARLARAGACLPAHDQAAGASPPADKRAYLLALWRGLAEISRVRQADLARRRQLSRCVCRWLRRTTTARGAGRGVRSAGSWRVCRSSQAAGTAVGRSQRRGGSRPADPGLGRTVRRAPALRRSFLCLCRALRTDEGQCQEKAFYAQHALPGVPLAKAQVSEGLWQGWVCTPRQTDASPGAGGVSGA